MRTNIVRIGLVLGLVAVASACGDGSSKPSSPGAPLASDEVVSTDAVVRYAGLEGGCWMLDVKKRGLYRPLELPEAYREDGLSVRVSLRDAPDMADICQMGPLVHLDSIERK